MTKRHYDKPESKKRIDVAREKNISIEPRAKEKSVREVPKKKIQVPAKKNDL